MKSWNIPCMQDSLQYLYLYCSLWFLTSWKVSIWFAIWSSHSVDLMFSSNSVVLMLCRVSSIIFEHCRKCSVVSSWAKHPVHLVSSYIPLKFIFKSIILSRISMIALHWSAFAASKYCSCLNCFPIRNETDYSVGIDNQLQSRGKSIQTINMGQTHLHTHWNYKHHTL